MRIEGTVMNAKIFFTGEKRVFSGTEIWCVCIEKGKSCTKEVSAFISGPIMHAVLAEVCCGVFFTLKARTSGWRVFWPSRAVTSRPCKFPAPRASGRGENRRPESRRRRLLGSAAGKWWRCLCLGRTRQQWGVKHSAGGTAGLLI